jgi:hypothetical protein
VSGSHDDAPARRRGAVPPPPSLAPDDAPDSIRVPRMEPPPPSLEAMVQSGQRGDSEPPATPWWVWALLLAAAVAVTGYVMR